METKKALQSSAGPLVGIRRPSWALLGNQCIHTNWRGKNWQFLYIYIIYNCQWKARGDIQYYPFGDFKKFQPNYFSIVLAEMSREDVKLVPFKGKLIYLLAGKVRKIALFLGFYDKR